MADPTSLEAMLACVQRELEMRERVYPRSVAAGRMNQYQMDWELAAMRAVLQTLIRLGTEQPVKLSRDR